MLKGKLFSRNQILAGAGTFFVIWLIVAFIMVGGEDKIVLRAFEGLDEKSIYSLQSENSSSKGVLGNFYSCLGSYRSIYKMKPRDGEMSHAKLAISEHYYFELSIINNEAFRFDIVFIEEGLSAQENMTFKTSKRSDSYAINCELSLLNKTS